MWTIFLKSLLNFLQYCFCLMFQFFGQEACGILASSPGTEPISPALEDEVPTAGPPGNPRTHVHKELMALVHKGQSESAFSPCLLPILSLTFPSLL